MTCLGPPVVTRSPKYERFEGNFVFPTDRQLSSDGGRHQQGRKNLRAECTYPHNNNLNELAYLANPTGILCAATKAHMLNP